MTRATFLLALGLIVSIPAPADLEKGRDARQIVLSMKRNIKASKGAACLSPEMLESDLNRLIQLLPKTVAGGESSGGHTIPRHTEPRTEKDQLAGGESSGGHTLPPGERF